MALLNGSGVWLGRRGRAVGLPAHTFVQGPLVGFSRRPARCGGLCDLDHTPYVPIGRVARGSWPAWQPRARLHHRSARTNRAIAAVRPLRNQSPTDASPRVPLFRWTKSLPLGSAFRFHRLLGKSNHKRLPNSCPRRPTDACTPDHGRDAERGRRRRRRRARRHRLGPHGVDSHVLRARELSASAYELPLTCPPHRSTS